MLETCARLYVHIVWATWDRQPLLKPALERALYACIQEECRGLRAEVVAIGGVEDHMHVLVRMPPAVSVSKLVQQVKGASSHMATHTIPGAAGFRWQARYGAFTVSPSDVPRVTDYIRGQKQRHHEGDMEQDHELEA